MTKDVLKDRESAFEYEFFHKVDVKLLEDIRHELSADRDRDELKRLTGLDDEHVLNELLEAGVTAETVVALSLMPLVRIAWADGNVSENERSCVLETCEALGHGPESANYRLMECWLDHLPNERVYDAWKGYVRMLPERLSERSWRGVRDSLSESARKVASAAGGVFGLHRISAAERVVLDDIDKAFP